MTTTLVALDAVSICDCDVHVGLVHGAWMHLTDRCRYCYTGHGSDPDLVCYIGHHDLTPCARPEPEICPCGCGHPINIDYTCDVCAGDCCGICCTA